MIIRELYLRRIRPFYHSSLIKVIMGIRRCGKSELMKQIHTELLHSDVPQDQVIYINFEDLRYADLTQAQALHAYVLGQMKHKGKYYLLFDEIQMVSDFQRVINSLKASQDVSIFVTGSNAKVLGGELATLLAGRYVALRMMPLCFSEAAQLAGQPPEAVSHDFLLDYLKWGGLPQRFEFDQEAPRRAYLEDVLNSIIFRDVLADMKRTDKQLTTRLLYYLFDNTGQIFSDNRVYEALKTEQSVGRNQVYELVDRIENAMAISKCSRYDLRGKAVLTRLEKYYAADLGLRTAMNLNAAPNYGPLLETVVYNQLIAQGYQVHVGKTYRGEVDFLVIHGQQRAYLQVAYTLADPDTRRREFEAFQAINDHYPKLVLSTDREDYATAGIQHLPVIDFLMQRQPLFAPEGEDT